MRVAPLHHHTLEKDGIAALDANLKESVVAKGKLYIGLLKSGQHAPGKFGKTWTLDALTPMVTTLK